MLEVLSFEQPWRTGGIDGEDSSRFQVFDRIEMAYFHFSRQHPAARSQEIDILHVIGANRLIAFTRSAGNDRLLIIASLRNQPFLDGYAIQTDSGRLPDGSWREVFNSDAAIYGGSGIGNFGADVPASGGRFQARVPANGVLVFQKT
jgi:1,4-alpha-glucan branching enzyme